MFVSAIRFVSVSKCKSVCEKHLVSVYLVFAKIFQVCIYYLQKFSKCVCTMCNNFLSVYLVWEKILFVWMYYLKKFLSGKVYEEKFCMCYLKKICKCKSVWKKFCKCKSVWKKIL